MPNFPLPAWAFALALIVLFIVILSVFGPGAGPKEPAVIPVDEALARLPQGEQAEMTLVRTPTGSLGISRLETATLSYHPKSSEVIYVLRGAGRVLFSDGEFGLREGLMLIVFAGTAVRLERSGPDPLAMLVFSTPPSEGDSYSSEDKRMAGGLKPMLVDVAERLARGLPQGKEGFEFALVFEAPTGSVGLFRVSGSLELHSANHWLYILKGRAKGAMGSIEKEIRAGQLVILPAGVKLKLKREGDDPLEFVLFSTPPFAMEDASGSC